jgi:hypothetical protein
MTWHDKVLATFPFISRSDIGPEFEEKCKDFGCKCAPGFMVGDISKNSMTGSKVRDHKTILAHSCYGKILEVAYCKIVGLDLGQVVFENDGPDTHDVKYGNSLIDVTSSQILALHLEESPYLFEFSMALSKSKYQSITSRSGSDFYKADTIAFLQQKQGNIFYFGQSKINTLLAKEVEEKLINDKPCMVFNFRGHKERVKQGLILLS